MRSPPEPGRGAATSAADRRTGLYFCRCGPNLGNVVSLGELASPAAWPQAADVAVHEVLCSAEGKAWLATRIREQGLDRVVVAACSPREHEQTFRGVLEGERRSGFCLQMVNLREQVEWLGGDPEAVTAKARRLVGAGLRRVALHEPLARREVEVSADVLVLGGGAAGIAAARALAQRGRKVVLAERSFVLGGLANQLDEIFPDLACAACFMEPVLDEVLHAERIEVLTGAELARVRGGEGRFTVELALRPRRVDPAACMGCGACSAVCPVERPDPLAGGLGTRRAIGLAYAGCLPHVSAVEEGCLHVAGGTCDACATACPFGAPRLDEAPAVRELQVGAIVVATGLSPGAVTGPDGLVSSYQLERMLHPDGPTAGRLGAGGQPPRAVLLATTAAEEDGAVAVEEILKLAHRVKVKAPEARVMVVGGLHEAPGLARRSAALRAEGVELLPARLVGGAVSATPAGGLAIRVAHAGVESVLEADLVVVHAASVPAQGSDGLAALLRLERDGRGFLLDRPPSPFEPTATRTPGVYVAGAAAGPRTIREAIRDGAAAAGRVLATLVPGETRSLEPLAAEVDASTCGGCAVCVAVCPFGAVALAEGDGKAHVDPVHCRGCGSCAAACPTGAASARHFTRAQIAAEISALLAT